MWFDVTAAGVVTEAIMQWHRNGGGGGLRGLEPPLISGGAPLFMTLKIFFTKRFIACFLLEIKF